MTRLAEVLRSGIVESVHTGSLVGLDASGEVAFAVGDPATVVLPRSANKPLQAAGMRSLGLELQHELLALAAASHSGEDKHLRGVEQILAGAGLDVSALQCPPDVPYGVAARLAWTRAGKGPERLAMSCSGKHAAMLATCVTRGWPVTTYCDPSHPLQDALRRDIESRAAEHVRTIAVDGCGAPLFGLSLVGLARAVRSLVIASPADPGRLVADAMRAHPEYVGGTKRDVTLLMQGVPGLVAKDGAEGVYLAALDDGCAVALKIDDGSARACVPLLIAALRRLGIEAAVFNDSAEPQVFGGGQPVGVVRATPGLLDGSASSRP